MNTYIITDNNIKVIDSFQIFKKKTIKNYIKEFREKYLDNNVLKNRTDFSLICEWKLHTLLYHLNYKKYRTKDVDLNYPENIYYLICYYIVGCLCYLI